MRYKIQVNMVVVVDKVSVLESIAEVVSSPALRLAHIGPQLSLGLNEVESAAVIATDETGEVVHHVQAMPDRFDVPN